MLPFLDIYKDRVFISDLGKFRKAVLEEEKLYRWRETKEGELSPAAALAVKLTLSAGFSRFCVRCSTGEDFQKAKGRSLFFWIKDDEKFIFDLIRESYDSGLLKRVFFISNDLVGTEEIQKVIKTSLIVGINRVHFVIYNSTDFQGVLNNYAFVNQIGINSVVESANFSFLSGLYEKWLANGQIFVHPLSELHGTILSVILGSPWSIFNSKNFNALMSTSWVFLTSYLAVYPQFIQNFFIEYQVDSLISLLGERISSSLRRKVSPDIVSSLMVLDIDRVRDKWSKVRFRWEEGEYLKFNSLSEVMYFLSVDNLSTINSLPTGVYTKINDEDIERVLIFEEKRKDLRVCLVPFFDVIFETGSADNLSTDFADIICSKELIGLPISVLVPVKKETDVEKVWNFCVSKKIPVIIKPARGMEKVLFSEEMWDKWLFNEDITVEIQPYSKIMQIYLWEQVGLSYNYGLMRKIYSNNSKDFILWDELLEKGKEVLSKKRFLEV